MRQVSRFLRSLVIRWRIRRETDETERSHLEEELKHLTQ